MTRIEFLKKILPRFCATFALVCLIFYTVYHVFAGSADSLMTIPVRQATDMQIIGGDAYLFRDERVLTTDTEGLVNDLVQSGTKVSAKEELVQIWDGSSPEKQMILDRTNRLITLLSDAASSTDTTLSKAEGYRESSMKTLLAIQDAVAADDWSRVELLDEKLLQSLNRYAVVTEGKAEIKKSLEDLQIYKQQLLMGNCETLSNPGDSGYYYGRTYVDGYEELFTKEALDNLDAASFSALIAEDPKTYEDEIPVGKVAYGYRWSLAIPFDATAAALFEENGSYRVSFPENGDKELLMTCVKRIEAADGGMIVVFESIEIPSDFVYYRNQRVEVTANTREGYYIPESALRKKGGEPGVYIFKNSTVCFRKIEIVYQGDGYYIAAEQGEHGDDYLGLYDILIISGGNLREGKVYK